MANRSWNQFQYTFENGPVILYAKSTYATTPSSNLYLQANQAKGFWKTEKVGTGVYKFFTGLSSQQPDIYIGLININAITLNSSISNIADVQLQIDGVNLQSEPFFQIILLDKTGAAVDPIVGESILLTAVLRNSQK